MAVPFPPDKSKRPALRFRDEHGNAFPEWEEKRLGEVADIIGGGTPDSGNPEYWSGSVPWFTPSEIKTKYLSESQRMLTESGLKASSAKRLPVGTLLLSTRATVGDIGIATRECCTNQGFQSLAVKQPNSNEFWYYWVNAHKPEFLRRASGSTFLEIGKSEVSKIAARAPSPPEQRKIADFLSAVDRRIAHLTEKKRLLEAYKRGLMQKLFSQEIRFRDEHGNAFPEREVKRLGEVCKVDWGNTSLTKSSYTETGEYLAVSASGADGRIDFFEHQSETPVLSAIGALCGKMFLPKEPFTAIKNTIVFVGSRNPEFLFYTLSVSTFPIQGAGQPFIGKTNLERLKIPYPSPPEQRKIADFLSAVDRRIAVAGRQVEGWQAYKRGLMQGLFPR